MIAGRAMTQHGVAAVRRRGWRSAYAALISVGLTGCACTPGAPRADNVEAPVLGREQVTILPKEDGSIGGVVVRRGRNAVLLDKPYATATIDLSGSVTRSTEAAQTVEQEFQPVLAVLPQRPTQFLLYFLEGTEEMTPESEAEVGKIFSELAKRPAPEILVIGHTDAVGSMQFNDRLSLQRAEHVRDELVRRGIPVEDIRVEGRGKREPVVRSEDGRSEPLNRRVEINVR